MLAVLGIASTSQALNVLYNFGPSDGGRPTAAALVVSSNTIYGTTQGTVGNGQGGGEIFKMNLDGTDFSVLHTFTNTPDGSGPMGGLLLSGNTLYGTTYSGGLYGNGSVFSINTDGNAYSVLYSFTNSPGGANPSDTLLLSGTTFFGSTDRGGGGAPYPRIGTVFSLNTNGSNYTTLASSVTNAGLVRLSMFDDTLYGTAALGTAAGAGYIFSMNTNGTGYRILHTFTTFEAGSGLPFGKLICNSNILYGTTEEGGTHTYGTIFSIPIDTTNYSIVRSLGISDGQLPRGGLCASGNKVYATASGGGATGAGTIFAMNIDGTGFSVLANFTAASSGSGAAGTLVLYGSTLFGVCQFGGKYALGTVFSLQIPAIVTKIASNTDGSATLSFSGAPTNSYIVEAAASLI
jgi:uncharacterized repeat protein (TIGR03803 family)